MSDAEVLALAALSPKDLERLHRMTPKNARRFHELATIAAKRRAQAAPT